MQETKLHNILVRGFDKSTAHYIKRRAKKNGRSVSKEILKMVKDAELSDSIKLDKKIV